MTACRRFDEEGLLLLEQGALLDDHFTSCPDCIAARAAHERLAASLSQAASLEEPPAAWQREVWAAIDGRRGRRKTRLRWAWLPAAAVAAAAAIVVVLRPPTRGPAGIDVAIEAGPGRFRGTGEARPGDHLLLRARLGGMPQAAVRVYRDDRAVVLSCSSEPPCVRQGDELTARLTFETVGSYQSVLLLSDKPLPAPAGSLEADAAAARRAGARMELGQAVTVR